MTTNPVAFFKVKRSNAVAKELIPIIPNGRTIVSKRLSKEILRLPLGFCSERLQDGHKAPLHRVGIPRSALKNNEK